MSYDNMACNALYLRSKGFSLYILMIYNIRKDNGLNRRNYIAFINEC